MRIVFRHAGDKAPSYTIENVAYFEPLGRYFQFVLGPSDDPHKIPTEDVYTIVEDDDGMYNVDGQVFDFMELYAD